ncbi:MAG: MerR family transcriptional regulator [Desulfovibrionales bacterium]|nr:MerR family transcriptional regulator [Desulfovibrionales bacterium]
MAEQFLTLREIAAQLDLPESSIRYYRDRFKEFIPFVGQGRRRRYTTEAVAVFAFISTEMQRNTAYEDIVAALARTYPQHPVVDQPALHHARVLHAPDSGLTELVHIQARALEQMSQALKDKTSHGDSALRDLEGRCDTLKRALYMVWGEVKKMQAAQLPGSDLPEAVEEKLHALDQEISAQSERLAVLETLVRKDMDQLKAQMERCQFWTQRLVLQYRGKNSDQGT